MKVEQIECGLSGVTSTEDDALDTEEYVGDDADLPEGWTKITLTHRRANPAWEAVQEVKELTGANLLSQVDAKVRAEIEPIIMVQMEAQFAALEARPGYSRTLLDHHVVFVAPHTRVAGLEDEVRSLCSTLGVEPELVLGDEYVEDEGDDSGDEDPAEAPEAPEAPESSEG